MKKGKITNRQLLYLIILNHAGLAILIQPSLLSKVTGRDAGLAVLVALVIAIGLMWLVIVPLMKRYPGQGLLEIMRSLLGDFTSRVLMLLFIFGMPFFIAVYVTRAFGDFVKWALLPQTPEMIIIAVFMFNVWLAARCGIQTLARLGELLFWPIMLLLIVLLFFLFPEATISNILPILDNGQQFSVAVTFVVFFPFLEIIIFLCLVPRVEQPERVPMMMTIGMISAGFILAFVTFLSTMVLGVELVSLSLFPAYLMSKKISVGHFFERLEVILAVVWFVTIFFRVAIMFVVSCQGLAQTFNFKDERAFVSPLALGFVGLAMIVLRIPLDYSNPTHLWFLNASIFSIWLPLFLLFVYSVRRFIFKSKPLG